MLNDSRTDIYDFLYNIFYNVVTKNVYAMKEPQELTKSDVKDGFIVTSVGNMVDMSEFRGQTYGEVRCYVVAYIPTMSRGRLDYNKYKAFEDGINGILHTFSQDSGGEYFIEEDSLMSMDGDEYSSADNQFFTFIKSFIVTIHQSNTTTSN